MQKSWFNYGPKVYVNHT